MTDEGVHSVHTLTAMLTWLACTVINVDFTIGATVTRLAVTIVFVYTMCTGGTMLARIRYALINILLTVCAGISKRAGTNKGTFRVCAAATIDAGKALTLIDTSKAEFPREALDATASEGAQ